MKLVVILLLLSIRLSAQSGLAASQAFFHPDSTKFTACIFYNPLNCVNCNYTLQEIFGKKEHNVKWEGNSFIIFPGLRQIEIDDYQKNLEQFGGLKFKYINNKTIYYNMLTQYSVPVADIQPFILIIPPYTSRRSASVVSIKDPNLISKIDALLAE